MLQEPFYHCRVEVGKTTWTVIKAECGTDVAIHFLVKHLKGTSALRLFRLFPGLRRELWNSQLWGGSYFVETIGSTSGENVRKYIERQKNVQR